MHGTGGIGLSASILAKALGAFVVVVLGVTVTCVVVPPPVLHDNYNHIDSIPLLQYRISKHFSLSRITFAIQ